MSTQIFKNMIPSEKIFHLLDSLCIKNDKHYFFDSNSFKKGMFTEEINKFLEECKPYYHISKRKYLEKKITYSNRKNYRGNIMESLVIFSFKINLAN